MTLLQSFRKKYGLTITDFAHILQCHRTQLSMAESGRRSLPPSSIITWRHLQEAVEQYTPPLNNTIEIPTEVKTFLQKRIKHYTSVLAQLELDKEVIEKSIATSLETKNLIAALQLYPLPNEAENSTLKLEIIDRKLLVNLKKEYVELTKIQLKISGLQNELATALNML